MASSETWVDRWQRSREAFTGTTIEPRASIESPATPLSGKELLKAFGQIETSTGVTMSPEAALSHPDVYACVRIITEYIAMLPIQVFRRSKASDDPNLILKQPAPNHPLWPLLFECPNPEMTAVEVVEAMVGHVLLRGNAYAHVVRNEGGQVVEIWPLRPDRVWVYRKLGETGQALAGGDLEYIYTPYAGTPIRFDANEIWHVKGLSTDGLIGYAPVQLQAEAMGSAVAAEKYAGRFFANDARPGGILVHPGSLSDRAYKRLQAALEGAHRGFDNAHKMLLLEEGISWQQVGLSPDDAQFLQTRQFNTEQISRIFRVSGRLLNDERHPSRLSAEDATAEDVRNMVLPWTRRFELTIKRDILRLNADKPYFAKFMLNELQRASLAARTTYYQAGRQNGWLSANDVRIEEGLNPIGPEGDHYMVPINMEPAENLDKPDEPAPDGAAPKGPPTTAKGPASNDPSKGSDNNAARTPHETRDDLGPNNVPRSLTKAQRESVAKRTQLRGMYAPIIADAVKRVIKRERADVLDAAKRKLKPKRSAQRDDKSLLAQDDSEFDEWLDSYYEDDGNTASFIEEAMRAPLKTFMSYVGDAAAQEIVVEQTTSELNTFMDKYLKGYADRHMAFSRADILEVLAAAGEASLDEKLNSLAERFDEMLQVRPEQTGNYETTRADGAASKETYSNAGRTELQWVGGACPFCEQFDGRTATISSHFAEAGQDIHSGDESVDDLEVSGSIGHPPLHRGCQCSIVAVQE